MAPKRKYPEIACLWCGVLFYKRNRRHFLCSLECRDRHIRFLAPTIPETKCATCGKMFTVKKLYCLTRTDIPPQRYCSTPCRQIGHRVHPTRENILENFSRNAEIRGPDECWPWKRVPGKNGYGLVTMYKFKKTAHRVSYELHKGPIPKGPPGIHGTVVMHTCDNRRCVNPNHLTLGTQSDNMKDMYRKGRARGSVNRFYCAQLPPLNQPQDLPSHISVKSG